MEHPRIDLAHVPDFRVGSLNVHPSTRELSRDGDRLVIEPRVMQVLVALYRAGGAVVSKDDLAQSCWEGRVVGEDAINRVISRLRKVEGGLASNAFRVETVTRVGYRLILTDQASNGTAKRKNALPHVEAGSGVSRRTLIGGAAALGVTSVAVGGWFAMRPPQLPPDLAEKISRANTALQYGSPEQTANAVALLRDATQSHPRIAAGWGMLALAYKQRADESPHEKAAHFVERSESAATRALQLDPRNVDAGVVRAMAGKSHHRNWADFQRRCERALKQYPDHYFVRLSCGFLMFEVGRVRESVPLCQLVVDSNPNNPTLFGIHALALWAAGRLEEADNLLDTAYRRFPRNSAVWFARFKMLAHSGRAVAAQAMVDDVVSRPIGIRAQEIDLLTMEAKALRSTAAVDVDQAMAAHMKAAHQGKAFARNAALFASLAGRLDEAFALFERLYFASPADPNEAAFSKGQGMFNPDGEPTYFLWTPPMKAARADTRFDLLTARLGLQNYWKQADVTPDYLA